MKKYCAIGFVELLIAIGVAGIAVLVLMNMAANGMKEAIRHERLDALTRMATGGALVVRKHAENASDLQGMALGESIVPPFEPELYGCYEIDSERGQVNFTVQYPSDSFLQDQENLKRTIIYGEDQENTLGDVYYIAYCINSVTEGNWVNVKDQTTLKRDIYIGTVIAGYVSCGNCGLEPYESPVVVTVVSLPKD